MTCNSNKLYSKVLLSKNRFQAGKSLIRKTKDGRIFNWKVENDDSLCTQQEAFEKVNLSLGFSIELKFDDYVIYKEEELVHALQAVLKVVFEYAKDRPIIFSTFQPDAARLIRSLQKTYPVYFLTNGGNEIYSDVRRNNKSSGKGQLTGSGGLGNRSLYRSSNGFG